MADDEPEENVITAKFYVSGKFQRPQDKRGEIRFVRIIEENGDQRFICQSEEQYRRFFTASETPGDDQRPREHPRSQGGSRGGGGGGCGGAATGRQQQEEEAGTSAAAAQRRPKRSRSIPTAAAAPAATATTSAPPLPRQLEDPKRPRQEEEPLVRTVIEVGADVQADDGGNSAADESFELHLSSDDENDPPPPETEQADQEVPSTSSHLNMSTVSTAEPLTCPLSRRAAEEEDEIISEGDTTMTLRSSSGRGRGGSCQTIGKSSFIGLAHKAGAARVAADVVDYAREALSHFVKENVETLTTMDLGPGNIVRKQDVKTALIRNGYESE